MALISLANGASMPLRTTLKIPILILTKMGPEVPLKIKTAGSLEMEKLGKTLNKKRVD
jgi:hypothetical protein